jgi:uncharacterized membrane protein
MITNVSRTSARRLHPLHAILLAFPVALFTAALLSDITYFSTFHIQWSNFASWLIAGGLVGNGFALLWTLIDLVRYRRGGSTRPLVYFAALLALFILGFINALVHAKDAWAVMPTGLYLSIAVALLGLVAAWLGYSGNRSVEVR